VVAQLGVFSLVVDVAMEANVEAAERDVERCRTWLASWGADFGRAIRRFREAATEKVERKWNRRAQRIFDELPIRYWAWQGAEMRLAKLRQELYG